MEVLEWIAFLFLDLKIYSTQLLLFRLNDKGSDVINFQPPLGFHCLWKSLEAPFAQEALEVRRLPINGCLLFLSIYPFCLRSPELSCRGFLAQLLNWDEDFQLVAQPLMDSNVKQKLRDIQALKLSSDKFKLFSNFPHLNYIKRSNYSPETSTTFNVIMKLLFYFSL